MVWLASNDQRVFAGGGKYVQAQRKKMSRDEIRGWIVAL